MNAVQLLEEVRRIPGYGSGSDPRFYYRQALDIINERMDELPTYMLRGRRQAFEAIFGRTPFDYIDQLIVNVISERAGKGAVEVSRLYHNGVVIQTLDALIRRGIQKRSLEEQNTMDAGPDYTSDLEFIRQMPSISARYFRRHQIEVPDEIELCMTDPQTLTEVTALKELVDLYARAATAQLRTEFFFDISWQNTPPNAPVKNIWAFRIKPS